MRQKRTLWPYVLFVHLAPIEGEAARVAVAPYGARYAPIALFKQAYFEHF